MTISTTDSSIAYTMNGSTVNFTVPFRFLENSDLRVLRTVISTGVETELTLDAGGDDGYTVTGAGESTGIVTVNDARDNSERLTIDLGNMEPTQLSQFRPGTTLPAEAIERALDKLTLLVKRVMGGIVSRVLRLIDGDTDGSGRYDANGNRIVSLADGVAADDAATVGQISVATGTFVAAGTGAVARTLQAKNRDIVSVLDFGVPNDGVTDIGTALELAITNRTSGASLRFPAGTYYLVGSLDVTLTSPLELILDAGAKIIGDSSDIPMLMIRGGASRYGLTVIGGQFDNGDRTYNAAVQSGTALALFDIDDFYIAGATFGRKTRDWIDDYGDSGISTNKCQRGTITGCSFYGQPDLGVYTTGGASAAETDDYGDIVVQGCRFYRCNAGVSAKRGLERLIVQGNTFFECRLGVTIFEAGGLVPGRASVISGNHFKRMQQTSIRVHGEGCAAITGNVIEDFGFDRDDVSTTARGIWLNGASRCAVTGNVIRYRDWTSDSNHAAIRVNSVTIDAIPYAAEENHISDNLIENVYAGVVESSAGVNHYPINSIHGATTAFSGMNVGARGGYWDGTAYYSLIAGTMYAESGTYTPTLTNTSNISASTAYACQYSRVNKTVTVSGMVDIQCAADSTATELRISLPIVPAFTLDEQAGGVANPADVTGAGASGGGIKALSSGAANVVRLRYISGTASTGSARTWHFTFTYLIP